MRKITKGAEPDSLSKWKQQNKTATYPDLPHEERQSVRTACIAEQFGLCAYCCQSITLDGSHNEHVEAQNRVTTARWISPTSLPVAATVLIAGMVEERSRCG